MHRTWLFPWCSTHGDAADEVPAACVKISRFELLHNVMIEVAPTAHESHPSPLNSKSVSQHCILFRNFFCLTSSSIVLSYVCAPSSAEYLIHPFESSFGPLLTVFSHTIFWAACGSRAVPFFQGAHQCFSPLPTYSPNGQAEIPHVCIEGFQI